MRPKYTLLSVFLASCLILGLCAVASAYTLSLETTSDGTTPKTYFNKGEDIYVNIVLDNRQGVAGCAFTLNYPSGVLEAPTIDAEGLPTDAAAIVSVFPFTFIKDGATTKTHRVNEQTAGSLFFSGAEINMTTGGAKYETAGQVVLFMVKFRVKTDATSGSYNFSLNQTQLHNPDAGYGTTDDVNSKAAVPILVGAVDKNHPSWNNLSDAYPIRLATMLPISKDFNIADTANGSVVINAQPDAMNATAPWILTDPNNHSQSGTGDQTLSNSPIGNYTIIWGDVSGWTKPSPSSSTQALTSGGTITFNGTYVQQTTPNIQVTQSILNFGYVPPGSYKDLILVVKNIGGGILTGRVSACPAFSILSGGNYSLGAGESQQVFVRYTAPLEEGSQTCSFVFTGGGGITVQVKGTNKNVGLPWLLLLLGN